MGDRLRVDAQKGRLIVKEAEGTAVLMDMVSAINMGGMENKREAVKALVVKCKKVMMENRQSGQLEDENRKMKLQINVLKEKEKCMNQIKDNWKTQLMQHEKAIAHMANFHQSKVEDYNEKIRIREEEITRLKQYMKQKDDMQKRRSTARQSNPGWNALKKKMKGPKKVRRGLRKVRRRRRRSTADESSDESSNSIPVPTLVNQLSPVSRASRVQ